MISLTVDVSLQFMKLVIGSNIFEKAEMAEKLKSMRILENIAIPENLKALVVSSETASTAEAVEDEEEEEEIEDGEEDEETDEVEADHDKVAKPAQKHAPTVRMANLCVIAGHTVNGVAAIHSEIVKDDVFNDFYKVRALLV